MTRASWREPTVGDRIVARNGRRAGDVGTCVADLPPNELRGQKLVARLDDGECVSYHPDDLDLVSMLEKGGA